MDKPDSICYSVWHKAGGMMYNRKCLSPDHPEYIYNYIKREFNVNPEDYGIEHPYFTLKQVKIIKEFFASKNVVLDDELIKESLVYFRLSLENKDIEDNYTYE